jgi:hypothetical protein
MYAKKYVFCIFIFHKTIFSAFILCEKVCLLQINLAKNRYFCTFVR